MTGHEARGSAMRTTLLHSLVAACLPAAILCDVFSLSSLEWTLKNANGSIAIPATVPSQAHLDLLRAGIITEPLLGINGELFCISSGVVLFHNYPRIHTAMDRKRQLDLYRRPISSPPTVFRKR